MAEFRATEGDPRAGPVPLPRVLTSGEAASAMLHPAVVLCWDGLLDAAARDALFAHVSGGPDAFRASRVYSKAGSGVEDNELRKSVVVTDDDYVRACMLPRLAQPYRFARAFFGFDAVPMGRTQMEVTASGDGDFFRTHCDDGSDEHFSRLLTFVYYMHRRPKPFTGGALHVFDSSNADGQGYRQAATAVVVEPADNRLVMFPSDRYHEVTRVDCPGNAFADRRFTVNGWYWAEDMRAFLASQQPR
jgi:hypothetical protein